MKRVMLVGALAAAAVLTALACGSDTVASPDKAVSSTGGKSGGSDSSGTGGDSSTHGNPGGNRRYPWLTITPEAAAVQLHNYLALHATLYDTNGTPQSATISWRSSDQHIATVGDTGLVHGVGLGVVTIFASADGVNDSAVVAVVDTAVASPPPPDSGTVPPDSSHRPPPPPPDSGSVPPDSTHRPPPPPPDSVPPDTVPPRDTLTSR